MKATTTLMAVVLGLLATAAAATGPMEEARRYFDKGDFEQAARHASAEAEENPANEGARILLAQCHEKMAAYDDAIRTWEELLALSRNEENRMLAMRSLCRLRRILLDKRDIYDLANNVKDTDPFLIPMPEIDYAGLEIVEDSKLIDNWLPPFVHETEHFIVASHNERLSKVVGERAEVYLEFMTRRLFGGREWAVRFPILVYATHSAYVSQGGAPPSSHGVTQPSLTGRTVSIKIFQLNPNEGRQNELYKYAIDSILPHELTHAMIIEFFGGNSEHTPSWLHEAVAGRFEQTRQHYREAAMFARAAVAGEHFRMRDLFEQQGYPQRVSLFYEQSANVVLYLFETGPEAMFVFLSELAAGRGHDHACAAALGLDSTENAVEEFEKRWVEWMKVRYIKDLADPLVQNAGEVVTSRDALFQARVNELDTVESLTNWRTVPAENIGTFAPVGGTIRAWEVGGGAMTSRRVADLPGPYFLGIRMNEPPPLAITCDVRYTGDASQKDNWFGFTLLDANRDDTPAEVLGRLEPGRSTRVIGLLADDLVLYIDGRCVGRYPAFFATGNQRDIDYPVALTAYGPMEIRNLKVARITKFSEKPLEGEAAPEDDSSIPPGGFRVRGSGTP